MEAWRTLALSECYVYLIISFKYAWAYLLRGYVGSGRMLGRVGFRFPSSYPFLRPVLSISSPALPSLPQRSGRSPSGRRSNAWYVIELTQDSLFKKKLYATWWILMLFADDAATFMSEDHNGTSTVESFWSMLRGRGRSPPYIHCVP